MISALFPGFLIAGALFATVPVLLHLLHRRPPDRQPLPTARFLREDSTALLRLSSRPSDLLLLANRVLFALALGAVFAGMTWTSDREGHATVVLIDAEAAEHVGGDALASAALGTSEASGETPVRVVAYARDASGAVVIDSEVEPLLEHVGEPSTSAADGLRALRAWAASEPSLDSASVRWVVQPVGRQWTRGVGLLRSALWPGSIVLDPVIAPSQGNVASAVNRPVFTLGFEAESPPHRALRALGLNVDRSGFADATPAHRVFAIDPSAADLERLVDRARSGATVVLSGDLPTSADDRTLGSVLPWDRSAAWEATTRGDAVDVEGRDRTLERPGRTPLPVSSSLAPGAPGDGAFILAVSERARPLAAWIPVQSGCLVYSAVSLLDPEMTGEAGYVDWIDDLMGACDEPGRDTTLDSGALATLARADLPSRVALANLGPTQGTKLTPFFLLLALLLVGVEVLLTRRPRS